MLRNILNRLFLKMAYIVPGGTSIRPWLHRARGVKIGKNIFISQSVYLDELHPEFITIGDNCSIGLRTSIFTHFYWGPRRSEYNDGHVVLEKDVFIGPHCVILPNVRIGQGAVIKAGTVVTRNIPPHTFWGTPSAEMLGRVTVPLTSEHEYEEFLKGLKPVRRKKIRS